MPQVDDPPDPVIAVEPPEPAGGERPGRFGLLAALLAGVAIGLLISSVLAIPGERSEVARQALSTTTTTLADVADPFPPIPVPKTIPATPDRLSLQARVPGLADGLVLRVVNPDGSPSHQLVWHPSATQPTRLTGLDDVEFDAAGEWYARIERAAWNESSLAIGRLPATRPSPAVIGVEQAMWHATEGSRIAWVGVGDEGRRTLFAGVIHRGDDGNPRIAPAAVTSLPDGSVLNGWTDAGYFVTVPEREEPLVLLDGEGEVIRRWGSGAHFVDNGAGGGVTTVVDGRAWFVRVAADGTDGAGPSWMDGTLAMMAPDGSRAVTGASGKTDVFEVETGTSVVFGSELRGTPLGWTRDSRFVILGVPPDDPLGSTVVSFADTITGAVSPIEVLGNVESVVTRRA